MDASIPQESRVHLNAIVGLNVAAVWRGAGTAIFFELGKLTSDDRGGRARGEATIQIEWSWRIEDAKGVVVGSFNEDREIEAITTMFGNAVVVEANCFGYLPEIDVLFSNGLRLSSYTTVSGDPEWAIRQGSVYMSIASGRFVFESAA